MPASVMAGETAQGNGRAIIAKPLSILALNDLQFGTIAASRTNSGTVTVDPAANVVDYHGGARSVCDNGSACTPIPATFAVRGERDRRYTITLPVQVYAAPTMGAGPRLIVDRLTAISVNAGRSTSAMAGILDRDGRDRLCVGGTLHIPAQTPPGQYSAKVPVLIAYS
ncbi:MAG: DUF4402 domain-containing protein [Pontixanthobacter sp.]